MAVSQGGAVTRGRQDRNAFGPGATNSEVARQDGGTNLPRVTFSLDTSKPYFGHDTSSESEPWVSIETGKSVSVTARVDLQQSRLTAEDIRYRTNDGLVVEASGSNPATLEVRGLYGNTPIPVLAVADTGRVDTLKQAFILGRIGTVGYDTDRRRVWLVPVNGATADREQVSRTLNAIYRQGVAQWEVQYDPQQVSLTLTPEELRALCSGIDMGAMSSYTQPMQAALRKLGREPEERTYLLFLVPGKAEGGVTGFMPLNRSAGFIYTEGLSGEPLARAIAHELGHGAYGLEHEGSAAGGSPTDNLMDYNGGTALTRAQWDAMHSGYRRLTWFQGADEGKVKDISLKWIPIAKAGSYTFISPAGLPFTVVNPTEVLVDAGSEGQNENMLLSGCPVSVYSFAVGGERYAVQQGSPFSGFYSEKGNIPYEDKLTASYGSRFPVWLYDRAKVGAAFPFREATCTYSVDDYLATNEGKTYNPGGAYRAAGVLAVSWDDAICLKKGGWYVASYNQQELSYLKKSHVLWTAIQSNPMVLGGEKVRLADYYTSSGLFDPSLQLPNLPERLWNCGLPNYWFHGLTPLEQHRLAFICGIVDGGVNTVNGIPELLEVIFSDRKRQEFADAIGVLLTREGFGAAIAQLEDSQWGNPNSCLVAYNNGKLTLDVVATLYGGVAMAKKIKDAGGISAFLGQVADNLTAIPRAALTNLKKANIARLTTLGYAFKKTAAEAYIYYTLNGNIRRFATFTSDGALIPITFSDEVSGLTKVTTLEDVTYLQSKVSQRGSLDIYERKDGDFVVGKSLLLGSGRFIAKSGTELKTYLDDLPSLPAGKPYHGQFYKSINRDFHPNPNPQLIDDYATLNLDHRYSKVGESGYYVSETDMGNLTEMGFLKEVPLNYARFRYDNVSIDNMLYLTDDGVRQMLGITDEMIKMHGSEKYKFTHILGTWAKDRYKGIVYPGAQGGDYTNIIIFKQTDVNSALQGLIPTLLNK